MSHELYDHVTHRALSLSVNIINSEQRRQRQTLRRCDLERALGGDTWCVIYIQSVTGGMDQTSGECSLGHTIPI